MAAVVVLHDQESSNTPEFPVGLRSSPLEVGVCVDQCVACSFLLLWAISVDCSEGTRAPGVRCVVYLMKRFTCGKRLSKTLLLYFSSAAWDVLQAQRGLF